MYRVGDKILHPLHGVGIIEKVEENRVLGEYRKYFVVNLFMKKMRILIPTDKCEEVGVRKISKFGNIEEVFEVLKKKKVKEMPANWNRRYKHNLDKIKTGDIYEVAEVMKSLTQKEAKKGLSMGEKKMLENVKQLIVGEIAYSKRVGIAKAQSILEEVLH